MRTEIVVALLCFGAAFTLGAFVSNRPPTAIDDAAVRLRGDGVSVARFYTGLGRWYAVSAVAALALAVAAATQRGVALVAAIALSQLVAQGAVEAVKTLFDRPRPDDWLVVRERGRSFPSGHSVTTVVFYGALLAAASASHLPRIAVVAASIALATCLVGIPWSRLALGAHYATDVAGGLLFGIGWLASLAALGERFGVLSSA